MVNLHLLILNHPIKQVCIVSHFIFGFKFSLEFHKEIDSFFYTRTSPTYLYYLLRAGRLPCGPAATMQCCDTTAVHATALENGKQRSSGTGDNSLTSLKWLPQFKIAAIDDRKDAAAVTACNAKDLPPYSSSSDGASSTDSVTQESEPEKEECLLPLSPIKRCLNQTAEFDKNPSRFEENPNKPPFSYTTIIYLAIRSCNKDKVMLGDIYQWIKDHFKYYRVAESTWQVYIHN